LPGPFLLLCTCIQVTGNRTPPAEGSCTSLAHPIFPFKGTVSKEFMLSCKNNPQILMKYIIYLKI
jgi:hypothetical protein